MKVTDSDLCWLWRHQPLLSPRPHSSKVEGTLRISAYYDRESGQMITGRALTVASHETFVADQFGINIHLDALDTNGWPKVFEIGLRYRLIAKRHRIPVDDLHFYASGYTCLGFRYPWDPSFTLARFLAELVEPFFYRLAYVDLYGLKAARADLWAEHSHGVVGFIEYLEDVRQGPHGLPAATTGPKRRYNAWR